MGVLTVLHDLLNNESMDNTQIAIRTGGLAAATVEALSEGECASYSVARLILNAADPQAHDAGIEREISAAIAKDIGREPRGYWVPTRLRPRASGLDTKTNAAGKYTVMTEVRDLIELLRNKARVIQLGATVLSGLTGNVQFPKQLTASAGAWVAENSGADVTASDATFGALTLSPKTYAATTSFSRQLLQQSTIDVENFVHNDLATAHALAIDLAALDGTGTSNQPLGLLRTTGIGSVVIAANAGGAPTYAKIVELETAVADANGDEAGMKFLTTPVMRGKLKSVPAVNATAGLLPTWQQVANAPGVGDLIGYPAYVSKQVPANKVSGSNSDCHCIILGYWPAMIIGEFGILDLVVDPYALKKQGMIEVTSFQMVDIGVRIPASFSAIQDARNV
jgi:HK97 family phage major capsid protein